MHRKMEVNKQGAHCDWCSDFKRHRYYFTPIRLVKIIRLNPVKYWKGFRFIGAHTLLGAENLVKSI